MTSRHARPSITRTTIAAAFAGVALVAACEAKLPTATEVDGMTASGAATLARKATLLSKDSLDAQYTVDGVAVSAAEANAIAPERIASIEVQKGPAAPNGRGMVSITTRKPGEAGGTLVRKQLRVTGAPGGTDTTIEENALPRRSLDNFSGVILIDGVRSTEAAMQALKPADIVSVEIIKGASAADQYAAPEAKNGVIRVTTRKTRTR